MRLRTFSDSGNFFANIPEFGIDDSKFFQPKISKITGSKPAMDQKWTKNGPEVEQMTKQLDCARYRVEKYLDLARKVIPCSCHELCSDTQILHETKVIGS